MSNEELVLPCKQIQTALFSRLMGEVSAVSTYPPRHRSPSPGDEIRPKCICWSYISPEIITKALLLLSHKHVQSITERSCSQSLIIGLSAGVDSCFDDE